jgi:hypothetical protein
MKLEPTRVVQVMVIKSALDFYLKTGMKVNSAYTLKAMLAVVTSYTGKPYTKKTAPQALADLNAILEENKK